MRLRILPWLAVLALTVGLPSAVASPLSQTGGATTAAPSDIHLVQDERDGRRDRRRGRRDGSSRSGGGDGVYTGGRSRSGGGDGVYTGGRSRSGGGDGVYTGGRGGDGVYTGGNRSGRGDGVYRGGNQGTVFCNPQLGCVRDLNINPGSGLGR
jgi:hypothetical protein